MKITLGLVLADLASSFPKLWLLDTSCIELHRKAVCFHGPHREAQCVILEIGRLQIE